MPRNELFFPQNKESPSEYNALNFFGEENYLPVLAGGLEDKSDRKKYFFFT
jgi:hypothetical protein